MDETPLFPGFCWLILTWNTYKSNSGGTFTFFVTRQLLFSRPSVPKHYRKSERRSNSQKFGKTTVAFRSESYFRSKPVYPGKIFIQEKTVRILKIRKCDRCCSRIELWEMLQKAGTQKTGTVVFPENRENDRPDRDLRIWFRSLAGHLFLIRRSKLVILRITTEFSDWSGQMIIK